jgi:polyhydroxyalkanoate synthesis regulator phasin
LILLLAIPVLMLFGNNLTAVFAGMLPSSGKTVAVAAPSTSPTTNSTQGNGGTTITTVNGTVISLPNNPTGISKTVATSGANGTTALLANQIESVAQQLLATGELTEAQYNSLMALANQGHQIGELERTIEQTAANSTDAASFMANLAQYPEFAGLATGDHSTLFGYATGSTDPTLVTDPLGSIDIAHGSTKVFLQLYQDVLNSGALNDPAVKQQVESLATNIAYLSEVALDNAIDVKWGTIPPSQLQDKLVSETTQIDSLQICTTGNGTDSGTQCQ